MINETMINIAVRYGASNNFEYLTCVSEYSGRRVSLGKISLTLASWHELRIDVWLQLDPMSRYSTPQHSQCSRYDMPKDDDLPNGQVEPFFSSQEEAENLLPAENGELNNPPSRTNGRRHANRQSSLSHPRPNGPRTSNRVRFNLDEVDTTKPANGHPPESPTWLGDEDYAGEQDVPLLTNITPTSASPFRSASFQPEDHLPNARPTSNILSAFTNMANSIIGAGIIGQPFAFRQAGLTMGVILLVGLTITVDWTIRLIVINSKLSGAESFQATMQHCFGTAGLVAISLAQWAFAFGGMIAFCVIIGDTLPEVIAGIWPNLSDMKFLWLLTNRRAVIILTVMGISWPLSMYRDIAKLSKASTLALISMGIILVTVITQGPRVDSSLRGPIQASLFVNSGFFQAVGIISFAFVCHHNSLLIYGSLRTPTMDRFATVTHYSTFISLLACLAMALSGFLTFGSLTSGNVLNNFPIDGSIIVQIARLCFGLNMLTTLPLEAFVCREVMNNLFYPNHPYHFPRHLIFSTGLVISAMSISLITCDLGAVFEIIGATSACALAYILPPLCYIKLSTRSWRMVPAAACIVFGVGVMVVSLVEAVMKMVRREYLLRVPGGASFANVTQLMAKRCNVTGRYPMRYMKLEQTMMPPLSCPLASQ
jgi:solute carrier family 38 (sodium-coupled neutral amino acid transporter), member 11